MLLSKKSLIVRSNYRDENDSTVMALEQQRDFEANREAFSMSISKEKNSLFRRAFLFTSIRSTRRKRKQLTEPRTNVGSSMHFSSIHHSFILSMQMQMSQWFIRHEPIFTRKENSFEFSKKKNEKQTFFFESNEFEGLL